MSRLNLSRILKGSSLIILLSCSFSIIGQSLTIKGAGQLCRKGDWYEVKWVGGSGPCDLKDVVWEQGDGQGNFFQLAGSGKQRFINPNLFVVNMGIRTFEIRVRVQCEDEDGVSHDISSGPKSIKIVDPTFYKLRLSGNVDCSSSNIELELLDPTATLTFQNLDNIVWTIPSDWSIASGAGTHKVVLNTNGQAEGQRQVKVKYKAYSLKEDPNGIIKKKCKNPAGEDKIKRIANFDIGSCKNAITYPPPLNHPSSHSRLSTTFGGSNNLGQNNFNFVSGGFVEIKPDFEFEASSGSDLNLFIEECSCSSPWHDPGRMAESSVSFPGQESGKKAWIIGARNTSDMGLNEITDGHPITIYPNPFDGQLQISGLPEKTQVEIQIKGSDSKIYWYGKQSSNDKGEVSLMMNGLQKGFYILRLRFEGGGETFKVIKK